VFNDREAGPHGLACVIMTATPAGYYLIDPSLELPVWRTARRVHAAGNEVFVTWGSMKIDSVPDGVQRPRARRPGKRQQELLDDLAKMKKSRSWKSRD
jgi:hypothetical protein